MQNLLRTRNSMVALLTILILTSLASFAVACPDYYESGCDGGWAWFGLRGDDSNLAQGQILTLDCDAAVSSVEFQYRVSGNPNQGVPSMVAGDEITAVVLDMDDNIIVTTSNTISADVFEGWIEFVFPEGFNVPAGQYRVVTYTNVPRYCAIGFCYDGEDLYDGGERTYSFDGINGPWNEFNNGYDIAFRVHLVEGTVSTQTQHWGSIKGMYR
jgi:hypothetical protein